jgi:hypothetical protein
MAQALKPSPQEEFEHFYRLTVNLREEVEEKWYRRLLTEYLARFVELRDGR